MDLYFANDNQRLTDLERYIYSKSNLNYDKWEAIYDFFEKESKDEKMQKDLQQYSNEDILDAFNLVQLFYKEKAKKTNVKRLVIQEFIGYTKHNLGKFIISNNEIAISTEAFAIKFSHTAQIKFEKLYTYDDITRERFFQLYHNSSIYKTDSFFDVLKKNKINWSTLIIIDKNIMRERYPKIMI